MQTCCHMAASQVTGPLPGKLLDALRMHPQHCCLQWVGTRRQTAATLVGISNCASQICASQTCEAGFGGAAACLLARQPDTTAQAAGFAWPDWQPRCIVPHRSLFALAGQMHMLLRLLCSGHHTPVPLALVPLPSSPTSLRGCLCPPCPAFLRLLCLSLRSPQVRQSLLLSTLLIAATIHHKDDIPANLRQYSRQ